nr:uncharacterized protein LOC108007728 [Drosophila suzukii]XP_036678324.1 uncharacterized protein LOC108007728 [Drosophila suzukii]
MVRSNSIPNYVYKQNEMVVNTAAMKNEDLSKLVQLNTEIEQRRRSYRHGDVSNAFGLLQATMTREELFETFSLDDDRFLTAIKHQNSLLTPRRIQVTDLDLSNSENLMKYFDEEVPVTPTKIIAGVMATAPTGKVASVIAKMSIQPDTPSKQSEGSGHLKISELKQKYEQQLEIDSPCFCGPRKTSTSLPMKVKAMAQMFNSKISQVMRNTEPHYVQLCNEQSQEAKSQDHLGSESQAQGQCLVAEEVFRELSVKDKALLFNKFIGDMAAKHPKFNAHAADIKAKVNKQVARGEVVAEYQASVKQLAQELEAKCILEPRARPGKISSTKTSDNKMEPCTSKLHVSTLTVTLKPSTESRAPQTLINRDLECQSGELKVPKTKKRNLSAIRTALQTEAYAPPKKIRRTRQERNACDNQMFFQNEQIETLFYNWLSTENGVQFDITSVSNGLQTIEIVSEKEQPIPKQKTVALEDLSQKPAVEWLMEEAIAKLELETEVRMESHDEAKQVDTAQAQVVKVTPWRIKRQAPPVPSCHTYSSASSCKPSEAEESESGLSTLTKITSDESQPETPKEEFQLNDFNFAKPQRPPRKKKMRRTLTWKKENSIVEATAITSTDSDSDYKPADTAPAKKKAGPSWGFPLPEQGFMELDKSLMRHVNSPRKIKSAYTLTVISSPSRNADSDQSPAQTPRQSLEQTMRDSFVDQGFETCSNEPMDNSPMRQSVGISDSKPSGFSTPVKGRIAYSSAQQQLFSPILSQERPRRSSLAMQVIREDHPLDLHATCSSPSLTESDRDFLANAQAVENNSTQDEIPASHPQSLFWVTSGDFTVSLEIFKNSPERLQMLYERFTQKSWENRDLAFGIDGHQFTRGGASLEATGRQTLPERPFSVKDCSHYWFASGDLAVPFSGKRMSGEKIERLFAFLSGEQSELRFGVDHIEFSSGPEFWPTAQKYSIESSYSMLVGLQTGASNGLEGRSKYSWPNNSSHANKAIKTSDLDRTEFETDSFGNNIERMSFSPDLFSLDYDTVPLDELFATAPVFAAPSVMSMPQMVQTLKQQQGKLCSVERRIRSYSKPSNLADTSLEHCQNTPQYVHKLHSIIRAIDNIGRDDGFRGCSMEQLESFMYFLCEYANVCLAKCSEHMDRIMDTLLGRRAVEV